MMKSLLIVEDTPDMRAALRLWLACEGFEVTTAEDGSEAIKLLSANQFDVVVTDLMMPQLDGIELIRRIKASDQTAHLPVIAITAFDDRFAQLAQATGATLVIRKPDGLEHLVDQINLILATAPAEEEAA